MTFAVKRGYSQKHQCYMYGIYKDGELYQNIRMFNKFKAELVKEHFELVESCILDKETGLANIHKVLRMDREEHERRLARRKKE